MTLPRCKPGDLCLIIRGQHIGKTTTSLREVSKEEVIKYLLSKTNRGRLTLACDETIWQTDIYFVWEYKVKNVEATAPYALDSMLLPIEPPADMTDDGMEAEKIIFHAIGNSK